MGSIASVAAITGSGTVFAVNEQGVSRQLKVGDVLQQGETIRTVGDVQVELLMDDGRVLAVAPNQLLRLDENVSESDQRPTAQDSAVDAPAAATDTVLEALERGTDLSTELEATAAGLGGGAGADGGSSFVQLLRIVEGVEPLAYEYSYTAPDLLPDLQAEPVVEPVVEPEAVSATSLVLSADPVVLEGSSGVTYTVTLGDPAVSDMTVTLSNGAVVVIPAGATTGSVLVPVQSDDVYKDGETLQATVGTVQGGGFTTITVNDTNVVTEVNDTIDTTPVAVAVSVLDGDVNNVVEGNEVTFRFSVNAAPQTDLTLNVTVGGVAQTVTIAAGSLYTDVTVDTRADESYVQGSATVTGVVNSISPTADGNFENLSLTGASATATVVDDGDVTKVSISASDVTENDAGLIFNIVLSNPPVGETTAQVLVGETTHNVPIGADGTGILFIATANPDVYVDPGSITATVTGVTGGNFEAVSVAGATATAQIADTTDTTTVLLDASLPMKAADGQYYTTITASVDNEPDLNAPLVLTITDDMTHMVVGTITIPAGSSTGDALAVAVALGVEHTYSVSSASGGNYESLDISDTASTYGPANILNLAMVTNSNVRDQYILVKFDQLADGVNHHFEQVVTLAAQGQQVTSARFDLDVGFDIDSAKAYDLSLTYMGNSAGLANEQLQITYLQVEHTVVEASHSNIKLGDANVAHDGIDITISPDSQLYTLGESDYYDRVSGAGSALDDAISGNNSDNVLSGGSGDDLLMGESGNDSLSGGAGTDALTAGDGNDTLLGGTGRDFLVGGPGSDTMTGGSGLLPDTETDVFKWSSGNTGADKITDFTLAPVASGGDVLDLTDLLVNENAIASSLDTYLSFGENELGQTVITVDANAGAAGGIGQTITLENVQFDVLQSYVGGLGDDAAIIARLLDDGNLKTDM